MVPFFERKNHDNQFKIDETQSDVSFHISFWNGKKDDERATGSVRSTYKSKKVGRFNKDLLPGERSTCRNVNPDLLKPKAYTDIVTAAANLRQAFYKYEGAPTPYWCLS